MILSRWLYLCLAISLAINLVGIGYLIGIAPTKSEVSPIPITQEMKGPYNELMKSQGQQITINQEQLRIIRLQMAQTLQQEPLNQKQLAALFDEMVRLSSKNIELSQQVIYQTMIRLPLSERIKIAKALTQQGQKRTVIPGRSS